MNFNHSCEITCKVLVNTRKQQAEKSKAKILQATLEVIASKGIRGTTHRAIAAQANIQLSLITYYFKDIHILIKEAYALRMQQAIINVREIWQEVFKITDQYSKQDFRKASIKQELCMQLSDLASDFLIEQVVNYPMGLRLERVLLTEAEFSEELNIIAQTHQQALLDPIIRFCQLFNRHTAETDATLLFIVLTQLEYQQLGKPSINKSDIEPLVRRALGNAMGLKHF